MKSYFLAILLCIAGASQSFADLICEGTYDFSRVVKFTIGRDGVIVNRNGQLFDFTGLQGVWDGQLNGMFTAKGFSMTYENHNGVYRNVKVHIFFDLEGSTTPSHIAKFHAGCEEK